ncbi:hypothetical protein WAK64_11935 [Bacillus spongiae]|uniref:Group-specific protein n=1 Tax=Bacillus spongiae TaxID=2683610 RepID=A0ABU8HFD6_9BACI
MDKYKSICCLCLGGFILMAAIVIGLNISASSVIDGIARSPENEELLIENFIFLSVLPALIFFFIALIAIIICIIKKSK